MILNALVERLLQGPPLCGGQLFHYHGVELGQRVPQLGSIRQAPQPSDKTIQPRCEKDQVPARLRDPVGMSQSGGNKDRGSGGSIHLSVLEHEPERSRQDIPGFIVGSVDVQVGWSGVGPLADHQGFSRGRGRRQTRPGNGRLQQAS